MPEHPEINLLSEPGKSNIHLGKPEIRKVLLKPAEFGYQTSRCKHVTQPGNTQAGTSGGC